jgi:hypothetical protein
MADWDREIYARDGFKCRYCDLDGTTFPAWEFLQIDHFKPRWKGGTDNPKNPNYRMYTMQPDKWWPGLS